MKLFCSLTSPYARKVRVAILEAGLKAKVQEVIVDPWQSPADFLLDNPLSKVPALRTEEGTTLPDSALILEYLIELEPRLAGAPGADRWQMARKTQLADGVIDASVATVIEKRRPAALISKDWLSRQQAAISRALDALEFECASTASASINVFQITLGCALAYLDFRNLAPDWRQTRPHLDAWFAQFASRESMVATQPPT